MKTEYTIYDIWSCLGLFNANGFYHGYISVFSYKLMYHLGMNLLMNTVTLYHPLSEETRGIH